MKMILHLLYECHAFKAFSNQNISLSDLGRIYIIPHGKNTVNLCTLQILNFSENDSVSGNWNDFFFF